MSDQISVGALLDLVQKQQLRIDTLEKRMQMAERQVEAAEQHSRQDCLILRGKLDIRPNCSLRDEVMRLIHYHTGVQFPPWCMNTVHWLGKRDSLIVRFNNKGVREAIYRNRVPKDVNKRGLFIHESLTSAKIQTISKCSKLRREGKLTTYYTQSGNVFIKKTRETPALMVSDNLTEQQISDLLDKQPATYREAALVTTNRTKDQDTVGAQEPTASSNLHGSEPPTAEASVGCSVAREQTAQEQAHATNGKIPNKQEAHGASETQVSGETPETAQTPVTVQTPKSVQTPVTSQTHKAENTQKRENTTNNSQEKTPATTQLTTDTDTTADMDADKGEESTSLASDSEMEQDKGPVVTCQDGDTTSETSSSAQGKNQTRKSRRKKNNK